jgi:hypothetical protein
MVTDLRGWYTVPDLATLLGVSENAIHMHRKHHQVTGRRVGRNVLLRLEDLEGMKIPLKSVLPIVTAALAHSY